MKLDLSKIPYSHRSAAANLLISKARRFVNLADLNSQKSDEKEINKARQALAYYDMALSLMKPHDVNYQTILNLKCLTLIGIGQYEDAAGWYEELIKIAHNSEGPNCINPTVEVAKQQLRAIAGKKNLALPEIDEADIRVLDDPPFCAWAESFCDMLQKNRFKDAHTSLSPDLGQKVSQAQLKAKWLELLSPSDAATEVHLDNYILATSSDADNFVGWCYFVVQNDDVNEALALGIYKNQHNRYEVGDIEFGRP